MTFRKDQDYLHYLAQLEGKDFQNEIEKLITDARGDFQPVNSDGGDGGSDGLYNNSQNMCCCYGLELKKSGLVKADLIKKIKEKFKSDLERILELESKGRGKAQKYQYRKNSILPNLLGKRKIKTIVLICNFENKALIGHFTDLFDRLKKESSLAYIEADCGLVFLANTQVATHFNISESSLFRIKHKKIVDALEYAKSEQLTLELEKSTPRSDFDYKFDDLVKRYGKQSPDIEIMRDDYFKLWCEYMLFMQRMRKECPAIVSRILILDEKMTKEIRTFALSQQLEPTQEIKRFKDLLKEKWLKVFDHNDLLTIENLVDMNLSECVGICLLDWRKKESA